MTEEHRKAQIVALLHEREGYLRRGQDERAAQVDEQLSTFGYNSKPPQKRAERRPRRSVETR